MKLIHNILSYIDAKMYFGIIFGYSAALIAGLFEKYFFNEWEYLVYLSILIGLDTFCGVWIAIKAKKLSSNGFAKLFEKIILYSIFLIATHVIFGFHVSGKNMDLLTEYPKIGAYGALIIREGISLFEKIGKINPDLVPKWILKKLKDFDDDGKFNESVK